MTKDNCMTKTFPIGGIHPKKYKLAADIAITDAGLPEYVYIPVKQHTGTPAKIVVSQNDKVKVGTLLAAADGIVSAPVHSSVSGEVVKISQEEGRCGYYENIITIKVDGNEFADGIDTTDTVIAEIPDDTEEIMRRIRNAGIVGMGGAGYPTPIKTTVPEGRKAEYLIINGIECEPFLCADERLMQEKAEEIIIGAKIINKLLGIQKAIIAIDENKPRAIEIMTRLTKSYVGVNVRVCKTKYPQGGEKQLIAAITEREVPIAKLPIDIGCVVQNAGTVFAVYEAVMKKKPLIERIVTISGDAAQNSANFRVRIGTPAEFLINKIGGITKKTDEIIFGGPFMGTSVTNLKAPVTKLTSGILLLSANLTKKEPETACIRCGKCVDACPQGLMPFEIARYARNNDFSQIMRLHARDCIECGSCAYICPARIPLLDYCKMSKAEAKKILKRQ